MTTVYATIATPTLSTKQRDVTSAGIVVSGVLLQDSNSLPSTTIVEFSGLGAVTNITQIINKNFTDIPIAYLQRPIMLAVVGT